MLNDFDPSTFPAVGEDIWRSVFPDIESLLIEVEAENEPADEYCVAQVPDTDIFILYGIYEQPKSVLIIGIRSHGQTVGSN